MSIAAELPQAAAPIGDEDFRRFRELIHQKTGIRLADSKRPLLAARLQRRLRKHAIASYRAYWDLIQERDPRGDELREMINAVTTNKTSFYREEHHFELLGRFLPTASARSRTLRMWSAACSTGEEPYTMAMVARESIPNGCGDLKILATDIDTDVLAKAASGVYPADRTQELPESSARRHFLQTAQGLVAKDELKSLIAFRQLNLIAPSWPLTRQLDAIFCRNVLIYFDRPTQEMVVSRLVNQLRIGGLLCLGHSEGLLGARADLENLGGTAFRKAS